MDRARSRAASGQVRPRDVAGFAEAERTGRLCVVPATPPRLLPGVTAEGLFRRGLLRGFAAVLGLLLVLRVGEGLELPGLVRTVLVLGGSAALCVVLLRLWWRVGDRNLEELACGYTTFVLVLGLFRSLPRRTPRRHDGRVPWDYRGIWVLAPDGSVRSAPDPTVEPPGFYPSPYRPGRYELWTGAAWTGQYAADR